MADLHEPVAETVFNRPELVQMLGGINEHTVLLYFAESQFFDPMSNNASLLTQSQYNQSMAHIKESRQALEGVLRTMSGIEFMLANNAPIPERNDVWIIRKQNRQRERGAHSEDIITILATYYVVGESIYMAPSVANVLQSKILSILASLSSLFTSASSLPQFAPARGHTYLTQLETVGHRTSNRQVSQLKKESFSSIGYQTQTLESKSAPTVNAAISDARFISDSFRNYLKYRDGYMDMNPLRGEPGSFVLSATKEHLQQQAAQKQQTAKFQADLKKTAIVRSSAPPTPQLQIDALPTRKGSKGIENGTSTAEVRPKAKRRKSKIVQSPTSLE